MDMYDKPIWHFTLREFFNIQRKELEETVQEMFTKAVNEIKSEQQAPTQEDNITLAEAAIITGLKEKSIYSKVSRLELPSITRGRPLMFSRAELHLWIKLGRPTVTDMALKRRKGEI